MNFSVTTIKNLLSKSSKTFIRFVKKHDTDIIVTAGVAGTIYGTVLVCKGTAKAKDIVNEFKEQRDYIENNTELLPEEKKKAVSDIYRHAGADLLKAYAPGTLILLPSVSCIFLSHKMDIRRIASVTAAYSTLNESFKSYRTNVIDKYGKDEDLKLLYGLTEEEIEESTIDKKGKEKKVKKNVFVAPDGSFYSGYARIFDETNPEFRKNDPEHNLFFLTCMQKAFDEKLQKVGHVWLNEVYDALGFDKTIAGQSVGWLRDNPDGDGHIDFGLKDLKKKSTANFLLGFEDAVLLDFNVDGVILGIPELGYAKI